MTAAASYSSGLAVQAAVDNAKAAAAIGVTQGRLAYKLNMQIIKDNKAPLVFPLIALSLATIAESLIAFETVSLTARIEADRLRSQRRGLGE